MKSCLNCGIIGAIAGLSTGLLIGETILQTISFSALFSAASILAAAIPRNFKSKGIQSKTGRESLTGNPCIDKDLAPKGSETQKELKKICKIRTKRESRNNSYSDYSSCSC